MSQTLVLVQAAGTDRVPTLRRKSPSSRVQRPSAPMKARALAGSWKVTVFVSPGSRAIFVKSRRRLLSGTIEATRSEE